MPNQASDIPKRSVRGFRKFLVLVTVFIGGYIVMALEILAFRIVYAGIDGSILATGAILGVVLSALAFGYWLGGTLSNRLNPVKIQGIALIIAGIWIISLAGVPNPITDVFKSSQVVHRTAEAVIEAPWKTVPEYIISHPISDVMEIRLRIDLVLASLILFALPSFLLAMVGPCGVQILTGKASEAGKTAGWVFALGSLGSIAGVVVTSFWLLAVLGTSANLRLAGLTALISGITALLAIQRKSN